jgi:hypothetical protein
MHAYFLRVGDSESSYVYKLQSKLRSTVISNFPLIVVSFSVTVGILAAFADGETVASLVCRVLFVFAY